MYMYVHVHVYCVHVHVYCVHVHYIVCMYAVFMIGARALQAISTYNGVCVL